MDTVFGELSEVAAIEFDQARRQYLIESESPTHINLEKIGRAFKGAVLKVNPFGLDTNVPDYEEVAYGAAVESFIMLCVNNPFCETDGDILELLVQYSFNIYGLDGLNISHRHVQKIVQEIDTIWQK